jgi:hypothetical protein
MPLRIEKLTLVIEARPEARIPSSAQPNRNPGA